MFTSFATAHDALEGVARDFDTSLLTGDDARQVLDELGTIRRLTDGMLAKAAKRLSDRTAKSGPPRNSKHFPPPMPRHGRDGYRQRRRR